MFNYTYTHKHKTSNPLQLCQEEVVNECFHSEALDYNDIIIIHNYGTLENITMTMRQNNLQNIRREQFFTTERHYHPIKLRFAYKL